MSLKSKCLFWIIVRLNVIARVVVVLTETGVDSHVRDVGSSKTHVDRKWAVFILGQWLCLNVQSDRFYETIDD